MRHANSFSDYVKNTLQNAVSLNEKKEVNLEDPKFLNKLEQETFKKIDEYVGEISDVKINSIVSAILKKYYNQKFLDENMEENEKLDVPSKEKIKGLVQEFIDEYKKYGPSSGPYRVLPHSQSSVRIHSVPMKGGTRFVVVELLKELAEGYTPKQIESLGLSLDTRNASSDATSAEIKMFKAAGLKNLKAPSKKNGDLTKLEDFLNDLIEKYIPRLSEYWITNFSEMYKKQFNDEKIKAKILKSEKKAKK